MSFVVLLVMLNVEYSTTFYIPEGQNYISRGMA